MRLVKQEDSCIKFEVVYVTMNVVMWYVVLWLVPVFGRNLLPVCSFLHCIPLNNGACKSTTQYGMLFQKAVSSSAAKCHYRDVFVLNK
jgi:hypothetical protein